nr:trehalase family glycosidase [Pseudomonas fluorescens]
MSIRRHLMNAGSFRRKENKRVEKYAVSGQGDGGGDGEYELQDGFGWTNEVTLKLLNKYGAKGKGQTGAGFISSCPGARRLVIREWR